MNILYDNTIFQLQQYGGISRYFYELIKRFSETQDIHLFQGIHINKYGIKNNKTNYNSYWGYEWKYKRNIAKYLLYGLFSIPHKLLLNNFINSKEIDVYHPTYYTTYLKNYTKSPIVLTVHDLIHEIYPEQFIDSRFVISAKKASINRADIIICISENTKIDLIQIYGVHENKIRVIPHGNSLSKEYTYLDLSELETKYNIVKPYILYVGDRKRKYKNFELVLNTYISKYSSQFYLVCFGGGSFSKTEQKVITKSGCTKRVINLSGNDQLLGSLYKHAFCLIYPSIYEGFGIPILEAMALGCPVIASNSSSIPEVAGNAALLFDPNSEKDLINNIELLSTDSLKRNQLISLGFKQELKFSWDKTAKETIKVYEDVNMAS
jgi:glycosyltransferase involved in cell wall biosynthesis